MRSALVLCALTSVAVAEPRVPSPREVREPLPRDLRIRPRIAQVASSTPTAARSTPMPRAPSVSALGPEPVTALDGLRDLGQPLSLTFNLGYQIDGSRTSGRPGLGAPPPVVGQDYAQLRSYGFGEAFLSTRGVGLQRLETYFALRFQAARQLSIEGSGGRDPLAAPIATWFERSGGELRTGWAEVRDFLPRRFGLSKLRLRAGDQYIYGPWIVHLSGLEAAYEGKLLTAQLFGGVRRADYARELRDVQPFAGGASLRFDLRGIEANLPIVVSGDVMSLDGNDFYAQPATQHSRIQLDWRPRRDVAVIGQVRWLDGAPASRRLEVRTRYKEVTNLVFELRQRLEDDWRWDPTMVTRSDDLTEAKRYLDLGPVLPQYLASVRGGTLIAENVDLYARFATAVDATRADQATTTYNASYLEAAGGLEVRLRRQLAFGATVLTRDTNRPEMIGTVTDNAGVIDPLPANELLGEDGFVELGTQLRMSLGARRFSAMLEIYGRRTSFVPIYEDPVMAPDVRDVRGGGRLTADAWLGRRARIAISYDVSSALDMAPEINGYKSLRLVATGVY